jgi:acetoin utilization protein AcuC
MEVFFNPEIRNYDFGPEHPFRGDRFDNFLRLYHVLFGRDLEFNLVTHEKLASDEELRLYHTQAYIDAMRTAAQEHNQHDIAQYVSQDCLSSVTGRLPEGIENAARAIVRNGILAVDSVMQGKTAKAISIGGGLHHAKCSYSEGFCVYNDVVIAARYTLRKYHLNRILVLDTDAHAGNGTYEAFYRDPRVLFVDMHQRDIYPHTGWVQEIGEGNGEGSTVNIPMDWGTCDAAYERFFDAIVLPLAREFQPQLIIRNGGADPHFSDSLTHLGLTLAGFTMIGDKLRQLSHELCNGREIDLIGSGYNPEVLPKAWVSLIAGLAGKKIDWTESVPIRNDGGSKDLERLIRQIKASLMFYWECMR